MLMLAAMFSFTACEDVPSPYDVPTQPGGGGQDGDYAGAAGSGTLADPYNTTAILKLTTALAAGAESPEQYYFKGKIVSIGEEFGTQYGNATFYISDDGTSTNQFYVFQALYLGNKRYSSGTNIKVGDEVVICGKVTNFKGNTPETVKGSAYVYSINGETGGSDQPAGEAKGTGTKDDPFNVAGAIAKCQQIGSNPSTEKYYVKGIAQKDATADASFNNITVDIADTDGGAKFTCYQVAGTDGKPLPSGFAIKKGDEVVVYGPIYNYKGNTPETEGKSAAYIVTVNGKATGEGGGGNTPQPGNTSTIDNPFTVAKALDTANALTDNETTTEEFYIKGKVSRKANTADEIGPNSSKKYKDMNYYISDDGTQTKELYVYRGKYLDGADFTDFEQLKENDEVVVVGKLQKYIDTKNGNAVVLELTSSKIVMLNGKTGSGEQGGGGQASGNSITFSEQGYQNQQDFNDQSITLGDAKLSFSKGSGSTTPKYYTTGTAMRLYGGNTLTISSSKTISKVEFTYAEDYNGTSYYPTADNSTVTPGTYDYSTHTWTGSANEIVLSRSASTGHFRIVSITITYAK